jgi:hypothetical protein
MPTYKEYRARNERALKEVKRAEKEIKKLRRELKAGTLDARKLGSGLGTVQKFVCAIPGHIPHFKATIDPDW